MEKAIIELENKDANNNSTNKKVNEYDNKLNANAKNIEHSKNKNKFLKNNFLKRKLI